MSVLMPLVGGGLIGLAASIALVEFGKIAGVSGIVGGLVRGDQNDRDWKWLFVGGLLLGGLLIDVFHPEWLSTSTPRSSLLTVLGGLLVGVGAPMGNGCTSGHGVCGLSRRSIRSFVATGVFMTTGILTASLLALGGF
jgi:uncharacterized protein